MNERDPASGTGEPETLETMVTDPFLPLETLDEAQADAFGRLLRSCLLSYSGKAPEIGDKEWLRDLFQRELPALGGEEAERLSDECVESVADFDGHLQSLNEAIEGGSTKERWFAKKVQEAAVGVSVNEFGAYLNDVELSIQQANTQMLRVMTNRDGGINQNFNLDGFMAEQHHVNSFNMQVRLERSPYVAEVMAPKPGQTYGKNSFDVVIRDSSGSIVHQYQMKYGATAQDTIRLIRGGNYNNQRIVVPPEQLDEVRRAFPGKSIESAIGNTDKVKTASKPLSKPQAKDMQHQAQTEGKHVQESWNHFQTKELAMKVAANAGMAGVQAAAITAGFDMARRWATNEKIEADQTIALALRTGTDAGVKAAAAAAVKIGIEKGIITFIPKGTPMGVIANVVCVGIENMKIMSKVASGELTVSQGLDRMGRTTTTMVYGIGWGTAGSIIGASLLSWIPIAGPIIGGMVGGIVAYTAGSKFGEAVYDTAKKIAGTANKVLERTWKGVKAVGKKLREVFWG